MKPAPANRPIGGTNSLLTPSPLHLTNGGTSLRVRPASNFTRNQFTTTIRRALDYIHAGDIYQVNLSQRFTAPWTGGAGNSMGVAAPVRTVWDVSGCG